MASLMDILGDSLDDQTVGQIGRQIGVDPQTAQGAVSAAIPVIVAALARNASDPTGAEALHGALERDHDGSLLEDLGGFLGGGASSSIGGAILGPRVRRTARLGGVVARPRHRARRRVRSRSSSRCWRRS